MVISDALPVQFWPVILDTFNESDYEGVFPKCFCTPWESNDNINIQFDWGITDSFTLRIYDSDEALLQTVSFLNTVGTVYYISFIPSDYSITNEQISLKIFQGSTERYKSDCLDIKDTWEETVLINYSNARNFASLNYSSVSPDPEFYLRIPAIFFHERFPTDREILELSDARSIQLNASIKAQKKLEIGPVPTYMHRKIKLILMHQFITIGGQDWIQEEEYDMPDPANKRWPLRQASVYLTEKDYNRIRNVL